MNVYYVTRATDREIHNVVVVAPCPRAARLMSSESPDTMPQWFDADTMVTLLGAAESGIVTGVLCREHRAL